MTRSARSTADFVAVVEAAADGQEWAVDALAAEYLPRLTAFAASRGATDPGGIADVVLFSVLRRLDVLDFEAPPQLWSYLCSAARSRMIDEHRTAKPVVLVDDHLDLDTVAAGSGSFDDDVVEGDYVADLLSPLTTEQRRVLELRFLDDLSIEETATRTGRSEGAVKGLQRRAIRAILAAVAVALFLVGLWVVTDDATSVIVDDSPLDQPDEPPPPGDPSIDGDVIDRSQDGGPVSADGEVPADGQVPADGTENSGTSGDGVTATDGAGPADEAGIAPVGGRYRLTVGSDQALAFGRESNQSNRDEHGARNYCVVSHFAYDDRLPGPALDGQPSLQMYWGNTAAGPGTDPDQLPSTGRGSCEGGTTDRSSYSIPAVFDATGQAVLPESIRVEYKSYGGPSFQPDAIQPIPVGLQLVAGSSVANYAQYFVQVEAKGDGAGDGIWLTIVFPSCVQVTSGGVPVLDGDGLGSHLSYPADGGDPATDCPTSHPYRIPTLAYHLNYQPGQDLDDGREWDGVAGRAVIGWQPEAMSELVECMEQALRCGFDRHGGRGQLPERFVDPAGVAIYDSGLVLVEGTDRTPLGPTVGRTP